MKKIFLPLVILTLGAGLQSVAQKKRAAAVNSIIISFPDEQNKKGENNTTGNRELRVISAEFVMEMKVPEGGANGAAVVYHPKEKLYYAAQAGNSIFPLIIFDKDGTIVSKEGQETMIDVRGLWYNPKSKKIEGNGYDYAGWFSYDLDKNGLPEKLVTEKTGLYQPDKNSPGVLNTDDDEVLFLDGLNIVCYKTDGTDKRKAIQIHIGSVNASSEMKISGTEFENNYNSRSIIYTGIKGSEIGFLNVTKKQVELYDIKSGYMSQVIKLPVSFTLETFFNFSYSNGIYWVFDKQKRKWMGYK
ncbi:MAG: hypothetical protein QM725_03695 [Lacibacter sp.]